MVLIDEGGRDSVEAYSSVPASLIFLLWSRCVYWYAGAMSFDCLLVELGLVVVLLLVFVGLFFGAVYRPVRVLGWGVDGEEFKRLAARVDEVVACAARDDDDRAGADEAALAFNDGLALTAREGEHLIDAFMHLFADLLAGFERHQHEL